MTVTVEVGFPTFDIIIAIVVPCHTIITDATILCYQVLVKPDIIDQFVILSYLVGGECLHQLAGIMDDIGLCLRTVTSIISPRYLLIPFLNGVDLQAELFADTVGRRDGQQHVTLLVFLGRRCLPGDSHQCLVSGQRELRCLHLGHVTNGLHVLLLRGQRQWRIQILCRESIMHTGRHGGKPSIGRKQFRGLQCG